MAVAVALAVAAAPAATELLVQTQQQHHPTWILPPPQAVAVAVAVAVAAAAISTANWGRSNSHRSSPCEPKQDHSTDGLILVSVPLLWLCAHPPRTGLHFPQSTVFPVFSAACLARTRGQRVIRAVPFAGRRNLRFAGLPHPAQTQVTVTHIKNKAAVQRPCHSVQPGHTCSNTSTSRRRLGYPTRESRPKFSVPENYDKGGF